MPIFVLHTAILLFSVFATFFWTKTPELAHYSLQVVGILILLYFLIRFLARKSTRLALILDTSIFTCLTLLIVLSTGGNLSPVFFLLYLLLFVIALLIEPFQSILLTLSLLIIFIINSWPSGFDNISLINLATLVLITPLALIFGKKYLEVLVDLGRIQILKNIITSEETDSLIWVTTKANPTLLSVIDSMGDTLLYLNSVGAKISPARLVDKLRQVHSDLILLYRSANDLKEGIGENGDEKQ